jgi:hypothetical protein
LHGDHIIVDVDKKTSKLTFEVSKRVGETVKSKRAS